MKKEVKLIIFAAFLFFAWKISGAQGPSYPLEVHPVEFSLAEVVLMWLLFISFFVVPVSGVVFLILKTKSKWRGLFKKIFIYTTIIFFVSFILVKFFL